MKLPTLYKRAKSSKVQEWTIYFERDYFYTVSGQQDGKKTTSKPTHCKPKNVGKSNETTAVQQASKEADAKWTKKLEGGYHEDITNIDTQKFIEPMLARTYSSVEFPCHAQPKLDGMRCIATKNGLFTRRGKPIVSVPHIWESLEHKFHLSPGLILDGELYNHNLSDNFNSIISLCKQAKPTQEDFDKSAKVIQYHVYDIPSIDATNFGFRYDTIRSMLDGYDDCIVVVDTKIIENQEDLDFHYFDCTTNGYEGQIVRLPGEYQFGRRSKFLLKRKDFIDQEFEIADITEGVGGRAGILGRVILKHGDSTFMAGARGDMDYYRELLENKQNYIGKQATIRYQNLTPDGIPRFGIMIAVRDYE